MSTPRIAFVGLGNIGFPVASRLAASGADIAVFDARPQEGVLAALTDLGAVAAETLADAVRGRDVLITLLPDSRIVERVVLSEDVLSSLAPGAMVIEMSSGYPSDTRRIAEQLAARGFALVDAPICNGGVGGAHEGTMTLMLGGAAESVAAASEVLAPTATTIRHAGEIGAGHTVKLISNLFANAIPALVVEAFAMGAAAGLDRSTLTDLLSVCAASNTLNIAAHVPSPEVDTAAAGGFRADLAAKDLRYAASFAGENGIPHGFSDAAHEFYLGVGMAGLAAAEARLSGWAWLVEPQEKKNA